MPQWEEDFFMEGFFNALSASLVLLMLMAVGYAMGQLGWMGASEKRFISKYIINIAVPCNCITGILNSLSHDDLLQAGMMVISAAAGVLVTLLFSMLAGRLLRLPRERWGVFAAMAGLSNTLFIGLPVSTQLFGEACIPYVMMYYLGNTTLLQSVGILLIEYSGSKPGSRTTVAGFFKDLLTKPPILAVFVTIFLLLLDLQLPGPIMTWGEYISNSVSPLALIYCGYIVYELGLKNLRFMKGLLAMLGIRLGIAPVICWCFCHLFQMSGLPMQVFLVESALPVVSQVPVLAGAYGADEQYAATGAVLSTLCSFFSIPILMIVLG